uniref:INCENP_ARK-bind domain-containing protein n=1 Tax=Onchocerca volvulus TaxID=6282 RepID=A0A8R1Y0W7_ONCVO
MNVESDVDRLLADSRINFYDIDRLIVCKFDADILSKINSFFLWLEEQKNVGKEIIRNETGRMHLPKTPKRGYCFSQEAEIFQKCRKKLLDSIILKRTCDFANDKNIATYPAQTPKSSRNAAARAIKEEAMLAGRMNDQKTPIRPVPTPRQCIPKQQTPAKVNRYPPITTSRNNTPKRIPLRNEMSPKVTTQKTVANSEVVIRKATVTPKTTVERIAGTPKIVGKKITGTPKSITQQPTFKRSEVIRKMEKRTNTVIKNKEEFMREKAERARRDREERALRVKMNNKKKEEEALEKLRIIKMREQQIEELRQKQRAPQRAISKSPCRTRGYYNRIHKPLIRSKSSQDTSVPKNVLQKEKTKDREENFQFYGKRNHVDSVKQDIDAQNKKQKLDLVECNERETIERHSTKTDTPGKVLNEELIDSQTHTECFESIADTPGKVLNKELIDSHIHIENSESIAGKNMEGRKSSQNNTHIANEPEKTSTVSEQEMLGSLRNCDVSGDIVIPSPMVENSEINEKENIDDTSQIMEVDTLTAETNSINNQTFDKSVDVLSNETLNDIGNNYDVESISSNDETDDEENPRKPIPFWAQGERLQNALWKQVVQPPIDPDAYFGPVRTPMLNKIFARNRTRYTKRTSSAQWSSPMSNPKKGTSKFFELQSVNHSSKP